MQAQHQKTILDSDIQLNIFVAEDKEFPPHWHEAVEVVYVLDGNLKIGVNNEVYTLEAHDIFVINGGDIHYFLPNSVSVRRIILHFQLSFLEAFAADVKNKRFNKVLIKEKDYNSHEILENQMLQILKEYNDKLEGYKIAMKARLFDILVILLRFVTMEPYYVSVKNSHLKHIERLEKVFIYVEENYGTSISLEQISEVANFSMYHFTRFFKEATDMTFGHYLNNYRISKAVEYLAHVNNSITEVAFLTGFGSIRTFNRVFKEIKGYSPSKYIKAKFD